MPSLKSLGSAVASAAVLASLAVAVAPEAAAATTPQIAKSVVRESKALTCAELSAQLSTQLQAAQTALAATTPDVVTAQTSITAAQATVAQLQAQMCLPTGPTVPPICVTLALQLKQNLLALTTALTTFPINQTQVGLALNAVLTTAAALQANACTTTTT
ncbi:hypothetical protein ACIBVL_09020 [Streptomyces sp. NPDC049687]|uniref:hypothetical protein n=1 Tax=Streptomyces sp. NPDC049687 TaxID=3365596 RepID=UPI0037B66DE8